MPANAGIQYSLSRNQIIINGWDYWIIRFRG